MGKKNYDFLVTVVFRVYVYFGSFDQIGLKLLIQS